MLPMKAAFFFHGQDIPVLIPFISDVPHDVFDQMDSNFKVSMYFFAGIEGFFFNTLSLGFIRMMVWIMQTGLANGLPITVKKQAVVILL